MVEAKSGTQLGFIKAIMERKTDEQLDRYAKEYEDGSGTLGSMDKDQETS